MCYLMIEYDTLGGLFTAWGSVRVMIREVNRGIGEQVNLARLNSSQQFL